MITWKNFYEENERRMDLLEEARHFRLILACLNNKNSRSGIFPFRIQPKLDAASRKSVSKANRGTAWMN